MAKIILKSRYLKTGSKLHSEHLIKYIALREGVQKIDDTWRYKPVSKEQKKLIACIAMRPEGVPSSFIRPMMGATCDPKIAIKPAIDAGFIKVRKERGINFFLATPEGAVIGSTTTHYDFIRYNEWFVETHPKIKDEWNLLVKFLLEGNNLKFRCPPKATARAIYMTGLFMDMSDGNDQSITLSEFGAWFRVEYLNQLDELTKP